MRIVVPIVLAFTTLLAVQALAQEVEPDDAEPAAAAVPAKIAKGARLRKSPGGATVGVIPAGTDVEVAGISNGWMRVRANGKTAWVDRRLLKTDAPVKLEARAFALPLAAAKPSGCPTDLASCPLNGCAAADSDHGILNTVKHGPPTGDADQLELTDFQTLQDAAGNLVGEAADLNEEDRKSIQNLEVGDLTTGEGHAASVSGFMVGKPHPNTGESVNCGLKGPSDNDIHITLAPDPGDTEFDGIVVEMIPQDRNAKWTAARLSAVEKAKRQVLVTGQLFYDNLHRVNANASKPKGGQPKRFSLWEVHPITEFLVCTTAPCDVGEASQWTKLEELTIPLAPL